MGGAGGLEMLLWSLVQSLFPLQAPSCGTGSGSCRILRDELCAQIARAFLCWRKAPQLLRGVFQAVVWASALGCAGGQPPWGSPGGSLSGCGTLVLCQPGAAAPLTQVMSMCLCAPARPGPLLHLGGRVGEHFAVKVRLCVAHPAWACLGGASVPVSCWCPQ